MANLIEKYLITVGQQGGQQSKGNLHFLSKGEYDTLNATSHIQTLQTNFSWNGYNASEKVVKYLLLQLKSCFSFVINFINLHFQNYDILVCLCADNDTAAV